MAKKFKFAPLSGAYMATSILGLLISLFFVYKHYPDWGIAFTFIFSIMFFASIISMTVADPDEFIEVEKKRIKK